MRGALAALLSLEGDLEVVGEVSRGDEVAEACRTLRPDVVLMDIEMPGLDGIAATAAVRRAVPGTRVLVVTTFGRPGYLRRAMEAGAAGFVVKDTPARELADVVRRVAAGLRVVDPALAAESLAAGLTPLTDRRPRCCAPPATAAPSPTSPRPAPVRGHGAQPPVRGHRQDGGAHARRSRPLADTNGWL